MYENRADHLSNNLRSQEISILIFFQFYCKINRNQNNSWSKPILKLSNTEFKILRKKPGDKAFRVSFKFSTHGLDQRLADFNRFSDTETRSCYSCLVLFDHFVGLALKGLGLLLRLWHMST